MMSQPHRQSALVRVLYLNAFLLAAIAVVLMMRGDGPTLVTPAYAAAPGQPIPGQPIAGGGSLYLMPAQFTQSTWGCYVMDTDKQTLCAYQFLAPEKELRFIAARHFGHDLKQTNFNTNPDPQEIKKLNEIRDAGGQADPAAPLGQ